MGACIGERLAEQGYTVYIDYTARWCLTCQWNKATVLETRRIAQKFDELGIYPVKGDFTNRNADMQKALSAHDRAGVPLNVIYPANRPDQPIVLPKSLPRARFWKPWRKPVRPSRSRISGTLRASTPALRLPLISPQAE